jgi:urease accessory protein
LLFSEKLLIEPGRRAVRQAGVMGSFDVFGNVLLLTPKACAERIQARVQADVNLQEGVASGACGSAKRCRPDLQAVGCETAQVKAEVRKFWSIAREEITGKPLPPPYSSGAESGDCDECPFGVVGEAECFVANTAIRGS